MGLDETQNLIISYTVNKQNKQLSLPVVYKGIDINREVDIKTNKMLKNSKGLAKLDVFSTGDSGNTFELEVLTSDTSKINALDSLYVNLTSFTLAFPASILLKTLNNKTKWIITDMDKSQSNRDYVVIKLTFHTYNPPATPNALSTNLNTLGNKFRNNCWKTDYQKTLKYKNKNDCVKLMKQILAKCGYDVYDRKTVKDKKTGKNKKVKTKDISNKWGKRTNKALKTFKVTFNAYMSFNNQKTPEGVKLKKKISSTKNAKMDKETFWALVSYNALLNEKKNNPIVTKTSKVNKSMKNKLKKAFK